MTVKTTLEGLNKSQVQLVDSEQSFFTTLEILKSQKVLGVDIEEHRKRSYLGFICLIQISTLTQIFLIDAIKLRSHISNLTTIFEDPDILKIFHGSINDTQ